MGRKKKGEGYARFTPEAKYGAHRGRAKQFRIPFRLTFEQWWSIWQKSGHWYQRGTNKNFPGGGYVIARFEDKGAYEIGNVRIITQQENQLEAGRIRRNKAARKANRFLKNRNTQDKRLKSLEK